MRTNTRRVTGVAGLSMSSTATCSLSSERLWSCCSTSTCSSPAKFTIIYVWSQCINLARNSTIVHCVRCIRRRLHLLRRAWHSSALEDAAAIPLAASPVTNTSGSVKQPEACAGCHSDFTSSLRQRPAPSACAFRLVFSLIPARLIRAVWPEASPSDQLLRAAAAMSLAASPLATSTSELLQPSQPSEFCIRRYM